MIHLMASHFVLALNTPRLRVSWKHIHGTTDDIEDNFNIDTSMEVEASWDDKDMMHEASITNFDAGNDVGKLIAFVAQLHLCSESTQDYLMELSVSNGCITWHIKLWICTH